MDGKEPKIIVTSHPPWYLKPTLDQRPAWRDREQLIGRHVFTCRTTKGLFEDVIKLVSFKLKSLTDQERMLSRKGLKQIVKDKVISELDNMQQKPSLALLVALLDLVDIENGSGMSCVSDIDAAGIKHVLLAYGNYTCFYIPKTKLVSAEGKPIVPVITQYSENHNFFSCDAVRSLVGTYTVSIPTSHADRGKTYFMQEVLCTHGLENLNVLKKVTRDRFEFWDVCLEVPTHPSAVTPSFQRIQPQQLLGPDHEKSLHGQSNKNKASHSQKEQISPMCCVVDKEATKHSVDVFTEDKVICDLRRFCCDKGNMVYLKDEKSSDGDARLLMVMAYRNLKDKTSEVYASTTLRFCRAVTYCLLKGSGEQVSFWSDTLKELARDTFISGTDTFQEIHNPALTAFIKRVSPNAWHHYLPKHIEAMISDPVMVQVVELGITLMEHQIPSAFLVAELLYCPLETAKRYALFLSTYSSDKVFRASMHDMRMQKLQQRITEEWATLSRMACSYAQKIYHNETNIAKRLTFREVFNTKTLKNINKVQRFLSQHKTNDKKLVQMYKKDFTDLQTRTKVLLLKLRIYHSRVKKYVKLRETRLTVGRKTSSRKKADVATTQQQISTPDMVLPDSIPVSTWIKNLSVLLLSEPWFRQETLRKGSVCTLLGLDDKQNEPLLCEWASSNQFLVNLLRSHQLEDRLSRTLITCLDSTLTPGMNIEQAPVSKRYRDSSDSHHSGEGPSMNFFKRMESSPKTNTSNSDCDMLLAGEHRNRKNVYTAATRTKTNKTTAKGKAASTASRESWFAEAEEVNVTEDFDSDESSCEEPPGETLDDLLDRDNKESSDEYDLTDLFIDDRNVEDLTEVSDSEDQKCRENKRKCSISKRKRKRHSASDSHSQNPKRYNRILDSESDNEDYVRQSPLAISAKLFERSDTVSKAVYESEELSLSPSSSSSSKRDRRTPIGKVRFLESPTAASSETNPRSKKRIKRTMSTHRDDTNTDTKSSRPTNATSEIDEAHCRDYKTRSSPTPQVERCSSSERNTGVSRLPERQPATEGHVSSTQKLKKLTVTLQDCQKPPAKLSGSQKRKPLRVPRQHLSAPTEHGKGPREQDTQRQSRERDTEEELRHTTSSSEDSEEEQGFQETLSRLNEELEINERQDSEEDNAEEAYRNVIIM